MKKGLAIGELAQVLEAQRLTKKDFLVDPRKITAYATNGAVEMAWALKEQPVLDVDYFAGQLTGTGHQQIGQWAGIPKPYYDVMLAHPELLAHNLQHWLARGSDRRMIRTLDGKIRGVLSDSYRALDNYDLGTMAIQTLLAAGATIEPGNCQITERKMYIKALIREMSGEVRKGDEVCAGVIIENSEIGYGALAIKPLVLRKVCDNGLIINELAHKKRHVGGKQDEFAPIELANDTKTADDKAYWLKVRDHIANALSEVTFNKVLTQMQLKASNKVAEPLLAIETVAKTHGFTIPEKENVLKFLLEGGDLSNFGFCNAVTRMAQDVESYDRSVELEQIGWNVMNMNLN